MLNRKRITIIILLCIATLGYAFFVFRARYQNQNVRKEAQVPEAASIPQPPHPDSDVRKEAQVHIDKLYAFSGILTPEEKTVYLDSTFALDKLFTAQRGPLLPQAEYERFVAHLEALMLENPEIGLEPHAPTESHEEVYERQQRVQKELADITTAIEEVKTDADMLPSAKEALLSILEHRRTILQNYGAESREMARAFAELKKTDPEIVGIQKNETGGYTKIYPNMLVVYKDRIHYPDGTVEEVYTGLLSNGGNDPSIEIEMEAYSKLLENTPPWDPPPPEHEGIRFSVEYKDVYVDAEGKQTSAQQMETSVGTPPELPQEYPEPIITEEEVNSWKESLAEFKTSSEEEEMPLFFEQTVGIPIDRFLEMTDAEIEAELSRQFSPSHSTVERSMTDTWLGLSSEESFKAELRQRFSPARFNQAIQILSLYGPKEGISRLKDVDPEVATHAERFLQRQQEE